MLAILECTWLVLCSPHTCKPCLRHQADASASAAQLAALQQELAEARRAASEAASAAAAAAADGERLAAELAAARGETASLAAASRQLTAKVRGLCCCLVLEWESLVCIILLLAKYRMYGKQEAVLQCSG